MSRGPFESETGCRAEPRPTHRESAYSGQMIGFECVDESEEQRGRERKQLHEDLSDRGDGHSWR